MTRQYRDEPQTGERPAIASREERVRLTGPRLEAAVRSATVTMEGTKAPFPEDGGKVERRIINPWTWQDQFGYVQANETSGVERVLHCAGQTSVDADGQPLHAGDMGAQVGQALDNLVTVLGAAGFALADVVRLNYYVTDVDAFIEAGEVYGAKLAAAGCRPASTLLGVSRLAIPSLLVEVEATAVQ
jgi:enamine deaminase RidA (YjgF/YER057c/UK114 family)